MQFFALPLARIMLSLVFIYSGYSKVAGVNGQSMQGWIDRVKGLKIPGTQDALPNPDLLAQIVAYGELVGGILLLLGILSRVTAFGLFVFTIVASVLGHAFWSFADAGQQFLQIQQFLKNMGIAAGLLHCLNHGLFKGGLFLCAGSVQHATGTKDMDLLGGVGKRMPGTLALWLIVKGAAAPAR